MWQAEESVCCMELDNVMRHLYCVINLLLLLKETYGQLRTGTLFVHKQLSLQLNSRRKAQMSLSYEADHKNKRVIIIVYFHF